MKQENGCVLSCTHKATVQCTARDTKKTLIHLFISPANMQWYICVFTHKDGSSQRQTASNYQDTAKGIHVCTRFSSGGGKQL